MCLIETGIISDFVNLMPRNRAVQKKKKINKGKHLLLDCELTVLCVSRFEKMMMSSSLTCEEVTVNALRTISAELTGIRLNWCSGRKKPSSCPINSSRITPSANWSRENTGRGDEVSAEAPGRAAVSYLLVHIINVQTQGGHTLVDKV